MIETERLILRPHAIADFDAVRRLWADPQVVRFISGTPSTTEDSWARLLRYIGHWTAFDVGYFVIADRNDGRYLGECGFMEFRREITPSLGGAAEVGWVLDPAAWGKGVAMEAMTAVIDWHRKSLMLSRLPASSRQTTRHPSRSQRGSGSSWTPRRSTASARP
jgi:RimJ/RimL family protein N-acetyltransferase